MITMKTGVPGSGKTLSMASELLANSKLAEPRAVYTNIDGLVVPHIKLHNPDPMEPRKEGVLYTTDWRQCPPGSMIIVDEAFLYGYDAKSAQASVPDYIRDLAVHRKDYSVDIWFIAQHPKLLHVALRRQVGKHQHYRRLFGWGRAVCYEWDASQDNLAATKTAVMTSFTYPREVFKVYKSAEQHNKPKFKLPWFVWLPVAIIPVAAWAFPHAYTTLSGAVTGHGIPGAPKAVQTAPKPLAPPAPYVPPPLAAASAPGPASLTQVAQFAGCIRSADRCDCLDTKGSLVKVDAGMCEDRTAKGSPAPVQFEDTPRPREWTLAELDALAFTHKR